MQYHHRGHIDNSIVPVIIIIVLLIAFHEQLGNWLGPWWAQVSGWDIFIFVISWVVALGLFGISNLSSYERATTSTDILLRVENSGAVYSIATLVISAGVSLCTLFYFSPWLLLMVVPFLVACLVSGYGLMLPVMTVARSDDGFIIEFPVYKQKIEISKTDVPVVLTEHRRGGAFGQPLNYGYRLNQGSTQISEFNSKTQAEQLGGFLSEFLGVALETEGAGV